MEASRNPTAGSAEPYWFEWQTGLLRLVEMLDEDSDVVAVAFQLHGTKGWDDLGVRFRDGRTRLFQMKHSRSGDTLTFGDLITGGEDSGPSLLRSLARAWKKEHAAREPVECVLLTNRASGLNWYMGRPPLGEFFAKVKERVAGAAVITDVEWDGEDSQYATAWGLFVDELSELQSDEQLSFLQALELETGAPDFVALEERLYERLATLTGLPGSSVQTLFNALHAHLRKWASHSRRETEWIDREALRALLAGDESAPPWLGHCEVETPEPFFPSRISAVDELRRSLMSQSPHRVDFLSAEPGAGKTSCASKLARSGAVLWQEQCVSVRFYAYRPIKPGLVDYGDDIAGVRPEALWVGLLWQIREHLRKTRLLSDLRVPVWLEGMPWDVARTHVLRLANALGLRWDRPFVICVDGIDHAARAQRKNLPQFLETLPAPDSVPSHVRFLLAGQPAESFPEYPFYLRSRHAAVRVHSLGELGDEDLLLLWRAAKPQIGTHAEQAVLRLLANKTRRRTLPAVYAVEDIRESATLEAAAAILDARPLPDPLHRYYDTIWSAATITIGDSNRLAAAFAILRERPTAELMASAFSDVGRSATEWRDALRALRPLVRETAHGFEPVHNDLRVHLDSRIGGDLDARRDSASALADHYRKPTSNRLAAHRSLLDLLITAGRDDDFADDFTVDWVIEGGALGIADETMPRECNAAFSAAIARQDWLLLHAVGCATLTFHRLHECVSAWSRERDAVDIKEAPTFLPVEGEPRPLELWTVGDLSELVAACQQLAEHGVLRRARVVLMQWIGGIPVEKLVETLVAVNETEPQQGNARAALQSLFERFGRICALCDVRLRLPQAAQKENASYISAVETGWAEGLIERSDRCAALRLWCARPPRYLGPWLAAVKGAAARFRWGEVRAFLNRMELCTERIEHGDKLLLGWYAARASPRNCDVWYQPFSEPNFGLSSGGASVGTARTVAQWVAYTNPVREPAQIVEELFPLMDLRGMSSKNPAAVRLLVRASAIIGRMLRYRDLDDFDGVEIAVPPATLNSYLEPLWCCEPDWRNLPHEEVRTPGEVGRTLAEIAWECGSAYRPVLRQLAVARFADVILSDDAPRVFDMLLELGEHAFLFRTVASKARDVVSLLHEYEVSSRRTPVTNLVEFTRRLEMPELSAQLSGRLRNTRIGYSGHNEWVFHPLMRWFELLRKHSPALWRTQGVEMLELDRIADRQRADNNHSGELVAQISAAAMACGPADFEALFGSLADRDVKYPQSDLATAVRDGLEVCLQERHVMSEESTLSRIALAIAVGRWPNDSSLHIVTTLLTANGAPPALARHPAWERAMRVAAEIQGMPANGAIGEGERAASASSTEPRTADEILAGILRPTDKSASWTLLREIATLAEQANAERHTKRDAMTAAALDTLESTEAFSRYVEFHDIGLMSRLHTHLTETERWRLMGAVTAITGEIRRELHDANWAFLAAFSAVDLMCRARAAHATPSFAGAALQQLLDMHWKWHGVPPASVPVRVRNTPCGWPDAVRRVLLSLTRTDGCEPLYMVMCGLRFFAEVFPDQIATLCREGLAEERAKAVLFSLAQMWATRQSGALAPALPEFNALERIGTLDDRLDSWAVEALFHLATGGRPRSFVVPPKDVGPEIAFPGDTQLFESEVEMNGLIRHNSFARMANERVRRAGLALGSTERAFRHLVRAMRESKEPAPSFYLGTARKLAFEENFPRPSAHMENLVGDAILHQCAGEEWPPVRAAAVRLAIGYGMDPWVASVPPSPWPDKDAWPDDFEVERWYEAGASSSADVAFKISALLEGADLPPDALLLGAHLHIPTYRRDLEFRFWLTAPGFGRAGASVPTGKTLAGWFGDWASVATRSARVVSIQFCGTLVNYPNSELDITPTERWVTEWRWRPDPENPLQYRTPEAVVAARYERWLGFRSHFRRTHRQPLLSRWVATRKCFPLACGELRTWTRASEMVSGLLSEPE